MRSWDDNPVVMDVTDRAGPSRNEDELGASWQHSENLETRRPKPCGAKPQQQLARNLRLGEYHRQTRKSCSVSSVKCCACEPVGSKFASSVWVFRIRVSLLLLLLFLRPAGVPPMSGSFFFHFICSIFLFLLFFYIFAVFHFFTFRLSFLFICSIFPFSIFPFFSCFHYQKLFHFSFLFIFHVLHFSFNLFFLQKIICHFFYFFISPFFPFLQFFNFSLFVVHVPFSAFVQLFHSHFSFVSFFFFFSFSPFFHFSIFSFFSCSPFFSFSIFPFVLFSLFNIHKLSSRALGNGLHRTNLLVNHLAGLQGFARIDVSHLTSLCLLLIIYRFLPVSMTHRKQLFKNDGGARREWELPSDRAARPTETVDSFVRRRHQSTCELRTEKNLCSWHLSVHSTNCLQLALRQFVHLFSFHLVSIPKKTTMSSMHFSMYAFSVPREDPLDNAQLVQTS